MLNSTELTVSNKLKSTLPRRAWTGILFLLISFWGIGQTFTKTPWITFTYAEFTSSPNKQLYVRSNPDTVCAQPVKTIKKAELKGYLNLGNNYTFGNNSFTGTVSLEIKGYSTYTGTGGLVVTYNKELNIDQSAPEQLFVQDFTNIHAQVNRFEVTVQPGFNVSPLVQDSLKLDVFYEEEFLVDIQSVDPLVTINPIASPTSQNPVAFSWNISCGYAPNYELQVLRLYNKLDPPSSNEQDITTDIDWNQALSIETGNLQKAFTLTLAEGKGYYIWRVRPIGNYYTGGIVDPRNWGTWSATPGFNQGDVNVQVTSAPAFGFFYNQFNDNINWIYSRSFTEAEANGSSQTKMSEKITYANGLNQVKQEQTLLQTEHNVLVRQIVQDFSGRPALSSMAAPISRNFFSYEEFYLKDAAGALYTAADFDDDSNFSNPSPVAQASLLASYYSDANADITIPNAEGFPFTRTLYFRDGTSRVKDQSGVGITHKTGSGHTTKTSYSSVADIELVRVFGDEAPVDTTVYKTITTDANGISSVNYISKEGQTIATCLSVGDADSAAALDPLPSAAGSTFTVNDTIKGNTRLDDFTLVSSKNISLTATTFLTLTYDIQQALYGNACANICQGCDYKVMFYIHNLDNPDSTWTDSLLVNPLAACSTGTAIKSPPPRQLLPGDYVVERKVISNNINAASGKTYFSEQEALLNMAIVTQLNTGNGTVVGSNLPVNMTTVNNFIDANNTSGLYTYLGASPSDTLMRIAMACNDTLEIPVSFCAGTCPTQDYEGYFETRWPQYSGTNGNGKLNYLPQYAPGEFNTMIANMLAGALIDTMYNCDSLFKCWDASVQAYETLLDLSNQSLANADPNDNYTFDLADHFLTCAGYRIKGFTNVAIGSPGYLSHAYAYFNYSPGANLNCEKNFCGGAACTQLQFDAFVNTPGKWNNFYYCTKTVNTSLPDPTTGEIEALAGDIKDSCQSACQERFGSFLNSVVALYHANNHAVEGYVFPDTNIVPIDTISFSQVSCMAQSLVNSCKGKCTLTVYTSNQIDSVGSTAEVLAMMAMLAGSYELQLPDINQTCAGGFTKVVDSVNTADLVVEYLNRTLAKVTDTIGVNAQPWNYYEALLSFSPTIMANLPCSLYMAQHPTVMVKAGMNSFFTTTEKLKVDVLVENTYLKVTRTYPENIQPGDIFNVTTQITAKVTLPANITATITDVINDPHFTLEKGAMVISGPFQLGQPVILTYTLKADATIPLQPASFVHGTILVRNQGGIIAVVPTGTSTINVKSCGTLYFYYHPDISVAPGGVNICDEFCGTMQACNAICFKATELVLDTISQVDTIRPFTCEEQGAAYLKDQLALQISRIVEKHRAELIAAYQSTCAGSANVLDRFAIQYDLGYHHYTLLYYDRAGNKIKTVSPAGVITGSSSRMQHPAHTFVTEYAYNSLQQLVRQKTPDGGETEFLYDNKGQLRFSVNAKQLQLGQYSYTKYDNLGRIIEAGQSTQDFVNLQTHTEESNFPTLNLEQRTITVYTVPANVTYMGNKPQRYLQNRVSYTYTSPQGGGQEGATYFSYDVHGNVEWLIQDIPDLGKNFIRYEYDLISNKVIAVHYNETALDEYHHYYTYDADQRILTAQTAWGPVAPVTTKQSPLPGIGWDKDATYKYYKHGPLKRIELGEDHIQGIDYVYTINGWLKGINYPTLALADDPGGDNNSLTGFSSDAFGMVLGYHANDFNRTGSPYNPITSSLISSQTGISNLFNGNISSWTLQTEAPTPSTGNLYEQLTGYKYRYDQLNRLKTEEFGYNNGNWQTTNDYKNTYTYDANGNPVTLNRKGYFSSPNGLEMDDFTFTYEPGTNRMKQVNDAINNGYTEDIDDQIPNNYQYDAVGNMVEDIQEGINNIEWDAYQRMKLVKKNNGDSIIILYDANGNKVVKKHKRIGQDPSITYYVRDAQGNIMSIYNRTINGNNYEYKQVEVPIYGNERLGLYKSNTIARKDELAGSGCVNCPLYKKIINLNPGLYSRKINKKEYELKDHLQNVRVTVSDQKNNDQTVKILSYNNYYAYGMKQPKRNYNLMTGEENGTGYRFGFNGQEQDFSFHNADGENYDFGGRNIYDPRRIVWGQTDEKESQYPTLSPYNFCANNPILFVDPDGKKIEFAAGTSKEFKQQFSASVKLLNKNNASGQLAKLQASDVVYYIKEGSASKFSGSDKTITWNPQGGILTTKGIIISPTTVLAHEVDHATDYDKNPAQHIANAAKGSDAQYDTKEERRVITGVEQDVALKLGEIKPGEVTRLDHKGTYVETKNSTTTEMKNEIKIVADAPLPMGIRAPEKTSPEKTKDVPYAPK